MESSDTIENLKKWMRKMGYSGKIPEHLKSICNAQTDHIWKQLVQKVKPVNEIQYIRNNILIDRLQSNGDNRAWKLENEFKYPLKEIEAWKKKQKLTDQVKQLTKRVEELELQAQESRTKNKIAYMELKNIESDTFENRKVTHGLMRKTQALQGELAHIDEKLSTVRSLTPVEEYSATSDRSCVVDLLQKCADRLEVLQQKKGYEITITQVKNITTSDTFIFDNSLGLLDNLEDSLTTDTICVPPKSSSESIKNEILAQLDNLLNTQHRIVIWDAAMQLFDLYSSQLRAIYFDLYSDKQENLVQRNEKEELTLLYAIHVENALECIKLRTNNAKLLSVIKKGEENVQKSLKNEQNFVRIMDLYNYQKEEVQLDAAIKFLNTLVDETDPHKDRCRDLEIAQKQHRVIRDNVSEKVDCLNYKLQQLRCDYSSVHKTRHDTHQLAQKLGRFTDNLYWAAPLTLNLAVAEIGSMVDFPLNFCKLSASESPPQVDFYGYGLDSANFRTLAGIVQRPWCSMESVVFKLLSDRQRLRTLDSLPKAPQVSHVSISKEELERREASRLSLVDKWKNLLYTNDNHASRHLPKVEQYIDLWLRMPFEACVPSRQTYQGFGYEHYKNTFDELLKKL